MDDPLIVEQTDLIKVRLNHQGFLLSEPVSAEPSPNIRSRVLRIAKFVIAIVVVIGLLFAANSAMNQWAAETEKIGAEIERIDAEIAGVNGQAREELLQQRERLDASVPRLGNLRWGFIGLAAMLYAAGLVPPGLLLRRALLALGQRPKVSTAIAAQLLGHVGKYVPGKAMVIVLRAGVLARDGVPALLATVSVFLETFLMMAVGAAISGLVVWWLPVPRWIAVTAVIAAVAASLPTLPPLLKLVAAKVTRVSVREVDSSIGLFLFAAGWFWSVLSWLLIGASFTAIVAAIPSARELPDIGELYAISTAAIGLAMVVGFASLLPGGAGIRELVLTTILGVALGTTHGLLAAIAARLLFMVVEASLAAVCWCRLKATETPADPSIQVA